MADTQNTKVQEQDIHQLLKVKREKLANLQEAGKDPFQITKYDVTHHSTDIKNNFEELEGKTVRIAGRVMSKRVMGKASFCNVQDLPGNIQVYVARDSIGEESYADFKKYDVGDIVGIEGEVFKTKTGETSIHAAKVTLLSKSLQILPEKFHGLTNTDIRYRQRYTDLIMNQDVKDTFVKRSKIISAIRRYLDGQGFLEVETPMLVSNAGGAAARPFETHYNALDEDVKLRISLELYLKRLIVGGMERVFEIGRVFRNEGLDTRHNPEFTLMELYQAYTDYYGMMDLTENMFRYVAQEVCGTTVIPYAEETIDLGKPFERLTMVDAVKKYAGVDFDQIPDTAAAKKLADEKGVHYEERHAKGDILNLFFEEFVEEHLIQPVFIMDHPVEISPLTKRKPDKPDYVERFELFIYGREMCNAYSELNDHIDHFPIRVKTLATNRRSETNIIRFNNHIFTAATDYLNGVYKKQLNKDCQDLQKAYADVVQESPLNTQKGYVKASFLEPDEEHDYTEQTLISLGEEVEHLLASGIHLNDITILVRKNKSIPRIADYFDKELHYKIVSDEAFRLDASLAICMMLDALRYLSDENNKIARAQLAIAYQNEVLQKGLDWNTLLLLPAESYLPTTFLDKIKEFRLMPLYELLEELFSLFEMNRIKEQDAYLFAFFDAVTDYLQNNSSELDGFIRYWDETLCSKTIPSGEIEGIRIFSIHKSKGLEFHTVLLPFCDWKLENETNNQLVWCAPQEAPFNALDILPINYSTQMAESIYGNDYLHERLQLWVDNLNLLYVAFTRAGKNLIIWSRKGQKGTMSELLANTLPMVALKEGIEWEEDCYEQGELCPSEKEKVKASTNKLTQKAEKLPIQMESMRHDIEFRQSNRSADFIQGIEEEDSDDRFINRGRMLHTLFSAIETANDIDPAIERLIFEGVIRDQEKENTVREVVQKAFSSPEIQDWYSGEWTLFNECAIIYKEKGILQTRRPDRVMMKDGQVVVVDFKFGKENPKYNKQVKGYMQLLTKMGYKNITGYLWYVDEEKIEKV